MIAVGNEKPMETGTTEEALEDKHLRLPGKLLQKKTKKRTWVPVLQDAAGSSASEDGKSSSEFMNSQGSLIIPSLWEGMFHKWKGYETTGSYI